jgi:toxin-antitoxin system PIN domain toxin
LTVTPDVAVLVAASRQDHPHHIPALAWLEAALVGHAETGTLVILPMVASGFLRLVTHPKIFVEPTPVTAAHAFLAAVLNSPGVVLLPLGDEFPMFAQLCLQHHLTGNAIPDAWIAAAAQWHHAHLVTFDKGFKRFMRASAVTVLRV